MVHRAWQVASRAWQAGDRAWLARRVAGGAGRSLSSSCCCGMPLGKIPKRQKYDIFHHFHALPYITIDTWCYRFYKT